MSGLREKIGKNMAFSERLVARMVFGLALRMFLWTVAILVLLAVVFAWLIVPNVIGRAEQAHVARAKSDLAELSGAIDQFRLDCNRYPTAQEGFTVLLKPTKNTKGWSGPYLKQPQFIDPWGKPYIYKNPGHHGKDSYLVESYVPNGKAGVQDPQLVAGDDL